MPGPDNVHIDTKTVWESDVFHLLRQLGVLRAR